MITIQVSSVSAAERATDEKSFQSKTRKFESLVGKEDQKALLRHLSRARQTWLSLYTDSWTDRRMDEQLAEAVVWAVERQFSKTSTIERIRGMWNSDIIERTLRNCIHSAHIRFGHNQRNLLRSLSDKYSTKLHRLMPEYIEELKEIRAGASDILPGYTTLVLLVLEPNVSNLLDSYANKEVTTRVQPDQISSAGRLTESGRRRRMKMIVQDRIITDIITGLTESTENDTFSFLKRRLNPLGGGAILEEMLHLGNEVNTLPEKYNTALYQAMRDSYYIQAPRIVWKHGLRKQIEQQTIEVHNKIKETFDTVFREFRNCESYMKTAGRLDRIRQGELLEKTYILQYKTKSSVCNIMEYLGRWLIEVKPECTSVIADSLNTIGPELTGGWVRVDPEKACILGSIPANYIRRFQPSARNLSHLSWLASLPSDASQTAYSLDERTTTWLRLQKKNRQLKLLCHGSTAQISAIMAEERPSLPGAAFIVDRMDSIKLDYLRLIDPIIPWSWTRWALQVMVGVGIGTLVCIGLARSVFRNWNR